LVVSGLDFNPLKFLSKVRKFAKLKKLSPGATIGVLAFGSPLEESRLQLGINELNSKGYKVALPFSPSKHYADYSFGFSNGSIEDRLAAFYELLGNPEVELIIAARGGYGAIELLSKMDLKIWQDSQKPIVGMSDVTVLLAQFQRLGFPLIHGITLGGSLADSGKDLQAEVSVSSLVRLLSDSDYRFSAKCKVHRLANSSSVVGQVIAGNLTVLASLVGTKWDLDYSDAILVIEDVGEAPYRLHRSMMQLKLAGHLDRLKGLVFGRFSKCESKHGPNIDQLFSIFLKDILCENNFPVVSGLEVGHWGTNYALALGCLAKIEGDVFEVVESPIK
jgi:muramoyltetrapeptide carboxypeptidase